VASWQLPITRMLKNFLSLAYRRNFRAEKSLQITLAPLLSHNTLPPLIINSDNTNTLINKPNSWSIIGYK
jgi:hypothetical protein